jgi:hypothetical protein
VSGVALVLSGTRHVEEGVQLHPFFV